MLCPRNCFDRDEPPTFGFCEGSFILGFIIYPYLVTK